MGRGKNEGKEMSWEKLVEGKEKRKKKMKRKEKKKEKEKKEKKKTKRKTKKKTKTKKQKKTKNNHSPVPRRSATLIECSTINRLTAGERT